MAGLGTQHADAQDPGARHGGGAAQVLTARRAWIGALALAGFAVTIAAYHPGLVTTDSIAQYEQAVAGVYTDAHPPLMAWLWSRLLHVVPGAAGLLWLHAAMLWLALFLFADGAAVRGARHAWLVVAVGFLPPVLGTAGEIWKDVGMASALALGAAIVHRASARGGTMGRVAAVVALVPLFYATAVRANAPAATGPVLVCWAIAAWPRTSLRRACAIAAGVLALFLVMQWGFERAIDAKRMHFGQVLETFDLAALACRDHGGPVPAIPPIFFQQGADAASLCRAFNPARVDPLYSSPAAPLRFDTDRSGLRSLASAWRQALLEHPVAYLAHRAAVFAALLGFGVADASRTIWAPFSVANPYGLDYRYNVVATAIGASVAAAAALGLYNGTPWIAVAAIALVIALHRRERVWMEAALPASALAYAGAYFVVGIAPDYRYLYWTVVASALAGALVLASDRRWAHAVERAALRVRPHLPSPASTMFAVAGFALTIAAFHPGELTFDSVWQYHQAVARSYGDHHPPVMAGLWSLVDRGIRGPLGMLLLQAALMWSALLLIADGAQRRGARHAWLIVAAGFLPPIIGVEGEIWKDVQMASSLLLAFALVYRATSVPGQSHIAWKVAALVPLFYGMAVRANAPAAVLPIAVYWTSAVLHRPSLRRALTLGAALVGVMVGTQLIVDRVLLESRRDHITQFLMVFDIAAIRCAGGEATLPPSMLRAGASADTVCKAFDPYMVDFLFAPAGAPLRRTSDASTLDDLSRQWLLAIRANPLAYGLHRIRVFGALLGFGTHGDDVRRPVWIPASIPNPYGFAFLPNIATDAIGVASSMARAIGLYNGLPWLVLAFAVLARTVRRLWRAHRDVGPAVLASSAILYTLPYLVIAIAVDYRYLLWTVVAGAISGVLAFLPMANRDVRAPLLRPAPAAGG